MKSLFGFSCKQVYCGRRRHLATGNEVTLPSPTTQQPTTFQDYTQDIIIDLKSLIKSQRPEILRGVDAPFPQTSAPHKIGPYSCLHYMIPQQQP